MAHHYQAGQVFNRMTLVEQRDDRPSGRWLCRCSCGNTKVVSVYDVRRGRVQSCGCRLQEAGSTKANEYAYDRTFQRLTAEGVRKIKLALAEPGATAATVAAAMGRSVTCIHDIATGKTWRDVYV